MALAQRCSPAWSRVDCLQRAQRSLGCGPSGRECVQATPLRPRVGRRSTTVVAGAAPEPFFAAAAASRVLASPWDAMDQQFATLDRQMDAMQRAMQRDMDSMLPTMGRLDRDIDQQMRAMERRMDTMRARVNEDVERSVREAQQGAANVRIERSEQRSIGSYRYYESVSIHSGGPMTMLVPAHAAAAPAFASPLLVVALLAAGAWAAVTAAFARNFECTTYAPRTRWQLAALWPFLAAFSSGFRRQFVSALLGQPVARDVRPGGAQ